MVRLAVGGDRLLQLAVAHVLLGDRAPADPGPRAAALGSCPPRRDRPRLVVEPVARRPDREQRVGAQLGIGVAGEGGEDLHRGVEVAPIEEALPLGEAELRFV